MQRTAPHSPAAVARSLASVSRLAFWLLVLTSCCGAIIAKAEPAEHGTAESVFEPDIQRLPPMEVSSRSTMGLTAGIALKGMFGGPVVRVTITAVRTGGRGEKLGVRKGDELIAINDVPLVGKKKSEVNDLLAEVSLTDRGSMDIRRRGSETPLHISWILKRG